MRLLLSLIVLTVVTALGARAQEEPVCPGQDLISELKAVDGAAYAALRDRASAAPNPEGRMWRVEAPGAPPSFLFGTIHRSDPRLTDLPAPVRQALSDARMVLLELTKEDVDGFAEGMQEDPLLMLAGEGPHFDDGFTPEEKEFAAEVLATYGLTYDQARALKPALIFGLISYSPCTAMRLQMGHATVDQVVETLGREAGAEVLALENAAEQLNAMGASGGDAMTQIMLASFFAAADADDYQETMLQAYLRDEIQLIWEFGVQATEKLNVVEDPDAVFDTFWDELVAKRNHTLADRAEPHLRDGNVVMAVGALHLPGSEGLVELLRAKGLTVTRVQ
jgi:uncharacterized protein YbaP (TraB family)